MVNMIDFIPAKHQHVNIVLVSIEYADASLDEIQGSEVMDLQ